MKSFLIAMATLAICYGHVYAQESGFEPNGAFTGTLYANFNSTLKGEDKATGFEVKRAYFGYKYKFTPAFSMDLKLDIGSPDDLTEANRIKRYAYFKTAAAYYQLDDLKIGFGLQSTYQYKLQNKFWTRRYLYKNIAEGNGLGPSADIGLTFVQKWENWEADLAFFNGEGYKQLQNDNSFKGTAGVTYKPGNWIVRVYGDLIKKNIGQSTYTAFVGYKNNKYSLGVEGTTKQNEDYIKGNHRYGFSTYGSYNIIEKIQLFGRYDYLESNIPDGDSLPWNLEDDGSAIVAGVEYNPIRNIKLALDYQDWMPLAKNMDIESAVFVHLEVKF